MELMVLRNQETESAGQTVEAAKAARGAAEAVEAAKLLLKAIPK
jgi:hypothetical protein